MSLLAGKAYDPAAAVSKATIAALAMTALDTANLRLAFVAPLNGSVLVRLAGTTHGGSATPFNPSVLLGVLEGTTVRGRVSANGYPQAAVGAATTYVSVEGLFLVTGLTAGTTYTWDAAYGVEVGVAASGLKYGGPNDATAGSAFGAFVFEIWDT